MSNAQQLHKDSIIIDATCPLASYKNYWQNWIEGGATAIAPTVNCVPEFMSDTMRRIGVWFDTLRQNDDKLLLISNVDDIYQAKEQNKLGIIFHFQGSTSFEMDLNNFEIFHRLGVRMVQLCYNVKDFVGDGCSERTDCGISEFGLKAIAELNRLGIVVDCAHTGYKTTMEAIEASEKPVIISHGNAKAVCESDRNLTDDTITAIANKGGVIGLNGYPDFVSKKKQSSLDDLIDHADYIVKLVGIDHISVGIDYFEGQVGTASDEEAWAIYKGEVDKGIWNSKVYSPPPLLFPKGIEMPEKLGNLTAGLLNRGYSEEDVKKIMGLNLVRVFKEVWS
jgi:membrane dipeptidase